MNLSTIIGMVAGMIFILTAIILGGDITRYVEMQSFMIVIGGTAAATLVSYSFDQLKAFFPMLRDAFVKSDINLRTDLDKIINLANTARREGLLALDGENHDDPFLQKGIELVVDGTDPELVKDILETEIDQSSESDQLAQKVLASMAQFAPAFGMVGTLIGLINMLMFLTDTDSLGPRMATALLTTFYGVLLANMVVLPFAAKLKTASELKVLRYEMMLEGILSIQNGENPRMIREKLSVFADNQMGAQPANSKDQSEQDEDLEGVGESAQEAISE